MNMDRTLMILDNLLGDLAVESATAESRDWHVCHWDGSAASLKEAVVVAHVRTRVDEALLEQMPACRVVARFGTGLDTVDLAAAGKRGIRVVAVRDYCIPELASHTLGLAFALDRRVDAVRSGALSADDGWETVAAQGFFPGRRSATVIGFGSIGSAVTRALVAIGVRTRVVTAHGATAVRAAGAEPVSFDEGFSDSGFVLLHCALTQQTAGMINGAAIARMSPGTILVNTARIGLMDEAAVATALASGELGGLGLDARLAPESPLGALVDHQHALLTPHIGWYSERSARDLRQRTILAAIDALG